MLLQVPGSQVILIYNRCSDVEEERNAEQVCQQLLQRITEWESALSDTLVDQMNQLR